MPEEQDQPEGLSGLTLSQRIVKRSFDLGMSLFGLLLCGWLVLLCFALASIDTRQNGFFSQARVGRNGKTFRILKIRSMRPVKDVTTTVTQKHDPRITWLGSQFRRFKLDELPQLWNVLLGDMSFVGPRPDVPGFADKLEGEDRIVLSIRPGITGPASLRFKDEESLLAEQEDPEAYNRDVIFPEKVRINKEYIRNYSFRKDLGYIFTTIFGR